MVSVFTVLLFAAVGDRQIVTVLDRDGLEAVVRAEGGRVRCPFERTCIVDGVAAAKLAPFASRVEADGVMAAPLTISSWVSTQECGELWELTALSAESVWTKASGEHAPIISVMDSGFRLDHPDFATNVAGQYDYGEGDDQANLVDTGGVIAHHGNFIFGVITAVATNNRGRVGLAPKARVWAQKIADDGGGLNYSYAIEAFGAVANGSVPARIVNYSISSASPPKAFTDAITELDAAGVILVAASSNCGSPNCATANNDTYPLYPSSHAGAHVLSVASHGKNGAFNPYSHYGKTSVDLAAPGVDICSFTKYADYSTTTASGTSYAAPFASAAAALVWEAHPDLTHREVVRLVIATAKPTAAWANKTVSGGVLDLVALVGTPFLRVTASGSTLTVKNVGAAGKANVVFFHDAAIELDRPAGVTALRFNKNDALTLPGLAHAPSAGTLWTIDVAAHVDTVLTVARKDVGKPAAISARAIVVAQALPLFAPFEGTPDASGVAAVAFTVDGASVTPDPDPDPDPVPQPTEDPTPTTPEPVKPKPTVVQPPPAGEAPKGCGAAGFPMWILVFGVLYRRRR